MKSLWNDREAGAFASDPLRLRVYTSRLLGREPDLVLHGGGNTSVKSEVANAFGETEKIIYVKGSGWDLATIEAEGFAPVRLAALLKMAELEELSDSEMVRMQRAAMIDPAAPNPSVEAVLHAFIPFHYVDHTHADAVVTITNTQDGEKRIRDLYGDRVLIVPYVMPGFVLAREIYLMTRDIDWNAIDGMVLLNHGVFTFADDARMSYERMIELVSGAEDYLREKRAVVSPGKAGAKEDLLALARLRKAVSVERGSAMVASLDSRPDAVTFSNLDNVRDLATRGPLTPDHVIRTKRAALIVTDDVNADVRRYAADYAAYFERNDDGTRTRLDGAPRWAVWPEHGIVTFGSSAKVAAVVSDIKDHTIRAIQQAERLGRWRALPERQIFDVEYWELEQAKLKRAGNPPPLAGKIALVTGAAAGIGKACADTLRARGAAVAALDIDRGVEETFTGQDALGITCDVTDAGAVREAISAAVRKFGGLDIVVSNAGVFPPSASIRELDEATWNKSIAVNLTATQLLLTACVPYLEHGVDASIVVVASKNVPAPGPGAAAYSAAKAGATQLARVAALELGPLGIRVNVVHPNNVFDTALWTPEVLEARAKRYGMTVEEYRRNSVLGVEVSSSDVAEVVCALVGPTFAKTTGAQIPVDGGNERVI